ncbi:type II toxin-antitoxin system RelB/DinJ family antitoxin [Jiella avicenniae]|uniref:Type II toxin-antitoxin system RelB/DinJ family antitoxin n=1 Tax=Jiella avicenniae TaxID=2907202 RepID=A0A9X1P2D1_9HYPH|nr:type II toxin-antitoxin system RelB/DinJ family antitoxin [Jiella avicenniae]MCE7028574.1 type II toxin-antitoxin system RelB/DinJ family antitoxin [Jiella avicenniae]
MAASEVVRARVDPDLKKQASAVLSQMGLSVSDAIRLMLVRVAADQALPFDVRVPNAETREALAAAERGETKSFATIESLMADLNDDES